jgi:hypothetical protein
MSRHAYNPARRYNTGKTKMPGGNTWQQWLPRLYNLRGDKRGSHERPHKSVLLLVVALSLVHARAGVTFITHGLNGNVDGWVTGMADQIPSYQRFLGTNYTCYKAYFYSSGGSYYLTATRVAGSQPLTPESGEIIVKFDWSNLADGNSFNTYQIASAAVPALLSTNFIPELGGHALAEFPLHLIGHSRGGSLVCEMSRLLGTNGVWVDQITTLDPHPLNDSAFPLDSFLYSAVDAPARTYASVLFHDNYWQNIDLFVYGKSVPGAYVRELDNLSGGYSSAHSDVHLWYHGTINLNTPATDTEATISSIERANWWALDEAQGAHAGFHYSLIGGGDRLDPKPPLGLGYPAVRDGYNQNWDLGAGLSANRTLLPSYSGTWPSLLKLNRTTTNAVLQGEATPLTLFYQWTSSSANPATIAFFLDDDYNPLNGNEKLLTTISAPVTGSSSLGSGTISVPLYATNAAPGWHAFFATITASGQRRYFYAPEPVQVLSSQAPPALSIARIAPGKYRLAVTAIPGQTLTLQTSTNLANWLPLATNTIAASSWLYTNIPPTDIPAQFYRATLAP